MANVKKSTKKKQSNKKSSHKVSSAKKNNVSKEKNGDIKGISYICVGILLAVAIYTSWAGALSNFSREIIYNLIGLGAYILPAYLIYFGIGSILYKGEIKFSRKLFGVTLVTFIAMFFCAAAKLSGIEENLKADEVLAMGDSLRVIMQDGGLHGGAVGHIIAYPISRLLGYIGSYILYFTLGFIGIVLIFDITLYDLVLYIKELRANKESEREYEEEATEEIDNVEVKKKPTFIEVKEKENNTSNTERKEFLQGINNKIRILDFMKNSSIDEVTDEVAAKDESNVSQNKKSKSINPFNIEVFDDIDESIQIEVKKDIKKESEIKYREELPLNDAKIKKEATSKDNSRKKEKLDTGVKEVITKEIEKSILEEKENKIEKFYMYPSVDLLNINSKMKLRSEDKKELIENATKLESILNDFGVDGKVNQVTKGPSVTRFELQPSPGVKVSKFVNLQDDIALGLAASGVRMEAPIPGKSAIGIEVPNKKQTPVFLREVLDSTEFKDTKNKLAFALGKDIAGKCVVGDLSKMPHMLIAGATGSGKSVCINTLIVSVLYKYNPDEVKLLMIDPKVVELSVYNGIPHLLIPVVTDPKKAAAALNWAVVEMDKRYNSFAKLGARNIESYNKLFDKGIIEEKLPYIVMIVDELADLMMACPHDVEDYICRLAQKARAAGMHLIIATQRPSVDVITGVIKANIPSRISFAVSSGVDSRTILDQVGAEKLLGRGDMLYYPIGEGKPLRVQGAFISEEEVEKVVYHIKEKEASEPVYEEEILEHINNGAQSGNSTGGNEDADELLETAIEIVVEYNQASTSFIQRKLKIGFNRASRIMDELEDRGIISPKDGSKPRQVLVNKEEL